MGNVSPWWWAALAGAGLLWWQRVRVRGALVNVLEKGAQYRPVTEAAEKRYGLPAGLLHRVAYQESRFRADIITGKVRSKAGAVGMFQFMPATAKEMNVDPLNVASAADGAARYLRQLYRMFGTWAYALMAYNWGPGNLRKHLSSGTRVPQETKNYVAQISADVRLA